jgi:hypothetical protein
MNIEYDHRKKWDTKKELADGLTEMVHVFKDRNDRNHEDDETINFQIYLFTKIANKKGA